MNRTGTIPRTLVQTQIQSRFNPLKNLTADQLTNYLDEFRTGNLRNLALVMDGIEERDDTLASVVPKAKAAVARHSWEILTVATKGAAQVAEALRQKQALETFYNNLRATSALDADELGSVSLLIRQMMDAKGKRYAVHNLVWERKPDGYGVTAHFAPLWFFENTTGRLRFIRQSFGYTGEDMEPGAWLVTKGAGVMIACTVAWMYKHLPLRDWLIYCSRHGMPGIEGVTDAQPDSTEWNALVTAVEDAASNFKWVRNRSNEIKIIDFAAHTTLPYQPLVERMDRAMAALWRGADLSTMSAGEGEGSGASLQSGEADIIEADDCAWISDTLNLKLDRLLLDYTFGEDAPSLAYFKLLVPERKDTAGDLSVDEFALRAGHPISQAQFAERYNRPMPKEDDQELLALPSPAALPSPEGEGQGEGDLPAKPEDEEEGEEDDTAANEAPAFLQALAADLQPFRERLAAILRIDDPAIFRARLSALLQEIEQIKRDITADPAAATALEKEIAAALVQGLTTKQPPA